MATEDFDLWSRLDALLSRNETMVGTENKGDTLQGIPWDQSSCFLDALLMMIILIVERVDEDAYLKPGNCGSDILKLVLKDTLASVKTPWQDRNVNTMGGFGDNIR